MEREAAKAPRMDGKCPETKDHKHRVVMDAAGDVWCMVCGTLRAIAPRGGVA
jgi:ribosomal protein S27E